MGFLMSLGSAQRYCLLFDYGLTTYLYLLHTFMTEIDRLPVCIRPRHRKAENPTMLLSFLFKTRPCNKFTFVVPSHPKIQTTAHG